MVDRQDEEKLKPPTLAGEIGLVLLMVGKVAAVVLAVAGVLTPLFLWRPLAGISAECAIYLAAMIVYMGARTTSGENRTSNGGRRVGRTG